MKYDVKYYDYIAQETLTYVVEAKDKAEAMVIVFAKYVERNGFGFDPDDYSVNEHDDNPCITTKYDALKEITDPYFNLLYNKALEYIKEE